MGHLVWTQRGHEAGVGRHPDLMDLENAEQLRENRSLNIGIQGLFNGEFHLDIASSIGGRDTRNFRKTELAV